MRKSAARVLLAATTLALVGTACGAPSGRVTSETATAEAASADTATDTATGRDESNTRKTTPMTTTPATADTTPAPSTPTPTTSNPSVASTTAVATPTTVAPATTIPPTTVQQAVERSGADVGPTHDVGDPLAIRIPSIGVDSALVGTGVLDDGTVAVPPDANIAGWFDVGPRPGERGPAVIMGHVDSARTGPGVFYRLRDIEVGAIASVDTSTGPVDFVVQRIEQHPKLEFPTEEVYGPVPGPALRLITCGGSFDRSVRSYYDNIIVYLVPVTA